MKFSNAIIALSSLLLSTPAKSQTIVDVAISTGVHTALVNLTTQASLVDLLSGDGPFTVFAPTDDAFAALPAEAGKYTTPEWSAHLTDILTYHVVSGASVMSTDLTLNQMVEMANGGTTEITSLSPPMVNTATIDPADVGASNGVVHVIDQVLLPPSVTEDIVAVAAGADDFSTLVELVTLADLASTLQGPGPLTVFAPTNDAFAAVDAATLESLKDPANKDLLVQVLTYHVFVGLVYDTELEDGDIAMVSTDDATISVGPPAMINDAEIVMSNILASNGVIHAIDKVLMPPTDAEAVEMETESDMGAVDDSSAYMIGSAMAGVLAALAMLFV